MSFVKGDVVYIKSGGPAMTIRTITYSLITVDWFVEHYKHSATFEQEQLTKDNPGNKTYPVIQGK